MLFSRKRTPDRGIVDFWTWWPSARHRIEAAIASGEWGALADEVSERVGAIHPDLVWEFGAGLRSAHVLVVSPGGDARLRAVAARWGALAPPPDATWAFHTSRQPDPRTLSARLGFDGVELDLTELRFAFAVDEDRHEIDVVCFHPAFARLPEDAHLRVTFLALDWLIGEEGVETWIGAVDAAAAEPAGARPAPALAAAVTALAAEHVGRGEPPWAVLGAEKPSGAPVVALVQQPLKAARWPRFDTHVAVTLPYRANPAGLPMPDSLEALRAFEDRLGPALGGDGELLAVESAEGRRTLHVYVDGSSKAAAAMEALLPDWAEGRARLKQSYDPAMDKVGHLRAR